MNLKKIYMFLGEHLTIFKEFSAVIHLLIKLFENK